MNPKIEIKVEMLSPHLFWDVDKSKIDINKNKKWLIHRILEYGLLTDWILIEKYFGIKTITKLVMDMRDLDKKSISFISSLSKIPQTEFKCYNTQPSNPELWNF